MKIAVTIGLPLTLIIAGIGATPVFAAEGDAPQVSQVQAGAILDEAQTLPDHAANANNGREASPVLARLAAVYYRLSAADRAEARKLFARPTDAGNDDDPYIQYGGAGSTGVFRQCSPRFCVHWETGTANAPAPADTDVDGIPDFVDQVLATFENVYTKEVTNLRYKAPLNDGDNKTDVYIGELGGALYGYAAPLPTANPLDYQYPAYLGIDNDFVEFAPQPASVSLEVTAAHEFHHILQFGYDVYQDSWMFESTATWVEDQVYPAHNDYFNYLDQWAATSYVPITRGNTYDISAGRVYGSALLHHFMARKFGPDIVRRVWQAGSTNTKGSIGTRDYNTVLRASGTSFPTEFQNFVASTVAWDSSVYADAAAFPDVQVHDTLYAGAARDSVLLDNTSYALYDVYFGATTPKLKLIATAPAGTNSAFAIVKSAGGIVAPPAFKRLPSGGTAVMAIDNPSALDWITAVAVDSEYVTRGTNPDTPTYRTYRDNSLFTMRTTTDFTAPQTSISKVTNITGGRKFTLKSNQSGSTFKCKIDSGSYKSCGSSVTYRNLKRGNHTFRAYATDTNLNVDASPAVKSFRL